jgi:hypothetical protein
MDGGDYFRGDLDDRDVSCYSSNGPICEMDETVEARIEFSLNIDFEEGVVINNGTVLADIFSGDQNKFSLRELGVTNVAVIKLSSTNDL